MGILASDVFDIGGSKIIIRFLYFIFRWKCCLHVAFTSALFYVLFVVMLKDKTMLNLDGGRSW